MTDPTFDAKKLEAGARLASALSVARGWVGLGAGPKADAYTRVILPNDPPRAALAHANLQVVRTFSSCALVALAYYRALGVADPRLSAPYLGRSDAVTQVVTIGRRLGAWRLPLNGARPDVGDVVLIGANGDLRWGTPPYEHVCILTGRDGANVDAVEGGQGRGGAQIGANLYTYMDIRGALWMVTPRGRRRVAGWASGAALAEAASTG